MGELGLHGITVEEEYGGLGLGYLEHVVAMEEVSRASASVGLSYGAHSNLCVNQIRRWGSDEQKDEWLPRLCGGERLASFGLTEPEAGSDAGNVRTRATLADGEWTVNGAKQFITNSGTDISGCVSITAVTGEANGRKEVSNLIVPNGTPGYEIGEGYRKMGWNASDTRPLSFEDCRLPESSLLGRRGEGFKNFLHILDGGRIVL